MATRFEIIAQELATDPLGRGYETTGGAGGGPMTDKEAADDLNTLYRDGAADGNQLVQYTLTEVHRTNTGSDGSQETIWSRMVKMSQANVGDNVFGVAPADAADRTDISAALTILRLLDTDVQVVLTNINDTRYAQLLDALAAANVMSQNDADTMKAFSQDKRTRGQELEVGVVREGDVKQARALP